MAYPYDDDDNEGKMKTVNVVIVESHQHALEHVHSALRRQKLLGKSWSMLHFDAHPDLACPRLPARSCFLPRERFSINQQGCSSEENNLYEWLDLSSSGIAEWIMPLVLAADLRVIEWVKPKFSTQLPRGFHRFNVGTYDEDSMEYQPVASFLDLSSTAQIKTDLHLPYYLDDDSVIQTDKLAMAKSLDLHVTELCSDDSVLNLSTKALNEPCSLDICLDYFSCLNPFLSDIDKVDPTITWALLSLMKEARCYTGPKTSASHLREIISKLLESPIVCLEDELDNLSEFFDSREEAATLIKKLKTQIEKNKGALPLVLKALPHWNLPHALSSISDSHMKESLGRLETAILNARFEPFLITICRSADDEFTPVAVVEFLQEQVLKALNRICCHDTTSRQAYKLKIIRDYGEWAGSEL